MIRQKEPREWGLLSPFVRGAYAPTSCCELFSLIWGGLDSLFTMKREVIKRFVA